jgi:hypothetical protein
MPTHGDTPVTTPIKNDIISTYNNMIADILLAFLVANALFWGLASHSKHCALVPGSKCLPHWAHLSFGIACFFGAVYVAQQGYVMHLFSAKQ